MSAPEVTSRQRSDYDVVVVGARAAGASTAMLLARAGVSVLMVDRAGYGSDTPSSHALMRGAVGQLGRWGLLEAIRAEGTPRIGATVFHYGERTIEIEIKTSEVLDGLYAPRRTVLDRVLVDAAIASGADAVFEARVVELPRTGEGRVEGVKLRGRDGTEVEVRADLVIGADGAESFVARSVGAPVTVQGRSAGSYVLRYFDGIDVDDYHWGFVEGAGNGFIPTNDGLTCVFAGVPQDRFRSEIRHDLEGGMIRVLREVTPELGDAAAGASAVGRAWGFVGRPGFLRKPWGPGWALVGDAGHWKDPYSAHGISDAFRDAELLSDAVVDGDLEGYERTRDRLSLPLFGTLERIASYDWDLPELMAMHIDLADHMTAQVAEMEARRLRASRAAA